MKTLTISALPCRAAATLLFIGTIATTVQAQQINTSAAATGLGGNYTARARGVNAVAWNPANLGLSGNPSKSFQLLSLASTAGVNPITLSDVAAFDEKEIPVATREEWMTKITADGGETGGGDGGVGYVGFSLGHLAFQASTSGYLSVHMNPDAAEAFLFGNAGRSGSTKTLNFAGSSITGGAFTTLAASYGMGIGKGDAAKGSEMSLGVTGKYVMGNGVLLARDNGSTASPSSISVNFPAVMGVPDGGLSVGSGIGFDLGFAWRSAGNTLGVTVMNAVNSFKWDEDKLWSYPNTATFDNINHKSSFDSAGFSAAPAVLKNAIADHKFKPTIAVGFSRDVTSEITVTADARQQLGDSTSILIGPKTQVGGGAELRFIPILPIRVGATYATGGLGLSAGVGLHVLGAELGVAGMIRNGDDGKQFGFLLSLINIR